MRLNLLNRIPQQYNPQSFALILQDIQTQLNNLSEGRLVARHNAQTSAPTTGVYGVGDLVYKADPSEEGTTGNKYIVLAWMCTDADPLTFQELRCLTGN